MTRYSFDPSDIFVNQIETHPQFEVVMYDDATYINRRKGLGRSVTDGTISLYELNVDRDGTTQQLIYPFMPKDSSLTTLGTVDQAEFASLEKGTIVTGSYPLTGSVEREIFTSATRSRIDALKNTLEYYRPMSQHFEYDSAFINDDVNLLSIPSILIGSGIKKGSVSLKWYYTGSLVGELKDENRNGELVSVFGSDSGSVAGVVLYNEGFILLTGSGNISDDATVTDTYLEGTAQQRPQWRYFASHATSTAPSSSVFLTSFKGTETVPTLTMFAHAPEGELINSANPTFLVDGSVVTIDGENIEGPRGFIENDEISIMNTMQSVHCSHSADFERQTFLSKVGIFDEKQNLIAIAKLANPVRKTSDLGYTFKLKLDL
jgi:hypothetical protein